MLSAALYTTVIETTLVLNLRIEIQYRSFTYVGVRADFWAVRRFFPF